MQRREIFTHLNHDYTEPIRDTLWQNIYLSPGLKRLISLDPFQKLGRIKQLGPTFHIYPGAVHTRLNHSLGVFHISKKLLLSLLDKSEETDLTLTGVKAFLTAALLHDLGHFPFAHSLKELPLKDHEEMTAEKVLSEPLRSAIKDWVGTEPEMVAEIVDENRPITSGREVRQYRRFLSGVLDPDKLDYLNRDAFFCGVPYGIQDTDYILHKVHLHQDSGVAIEADAVTAVENVLFSKYLMYRTVYWHRVVRIATAMIKQAVYAGLLEEKISADQLYWLDDEEFYHTFFSKDYAPFRLINQVMRRQFFKTVYEVPFDPSNELHQSLCSLDARLRYQERIAAHISNTLNTTLPPHEVVIDIPEQISFEVDLYIKNDDGYVPFVESGSVFSRPVVSGFTAALRQIRLFLPSQYAGRINNPSELFQ